MMENDIFALTSYTAYYSQNRAHGAQGDYIALVRWEAMIYSSRATLSENKHVGYAAYL